MFDFSCKESSTSSEPVDRPDTSIGLYPAKVSNDFVFVDVEGVDQNRATKLLALA